MVLKLSSVAVHKPRPTIIGMSVRFTMQPDLSPENKRNNGIGSKDFKFSKLSRKLTFLCNKHSEVEREMIS